MIVKFEATFEIDDNNVYKLESIKNQLMYRVEEHPAVKTTYSSHISMEEKSKDLRDFANGDLVVHIASPLEYLHFVKALENCGYAIGNSKDYFLSANCYDSRYPYFFIEESNSRIMNEDLSFPLVCKYVRKTDLALKEFAELDFAECGRDKEDDYEYEN